MLDMRFAVYTYELMHRDSSTILHVVRVLDTRAVHGVETKASLTLLGKFWTLHNDERADRI